MTRIERPSPRVVLSWLVWLSVLTLATIVLHERRTNLQQVHVVLIFLLIVLGGTAYGGRLLGIGLAVSGFVLIDYFFQAPYDRLTVGSSLDWFVLVAFLATAAVTTNLLGRAQRAAARAKRHASEVAHLSRFGGELLSAGRAQQALEAVVDAVRETLGAHTGLVYLVHSDDEVELLVRRGAESTPDLAVVRDVARGNGEAGVRRDGSLVRHLMTGDTDSAPDADTDRNGRGPPRDEQLLALWMPLRVRDRIVGVVGAMSDKPLDLDETHWRFAHALRFYAALAVERVRLVAATEHADAMRETDRLRNALLASVSHDLRTPLTTIKVLAQESIRQRSLDTAVSNARIIEEHADRLARVVGNVLDVTRLRGNTLPLHPEFNTAEDLIGAVARQVAGILGDHTLERQIDEEGSLLAGFFDFVHSLRILTNVVENAIRYSPAGAPIMLRAKRDGDELVFDVADCGPGVTPAQRERIFEPFYRAPGAAPDIGGTGLGLYIARALAEVQGGTLTYKPRAPTGSVFVVRLPAMDVTELEPSEWPEGEGLGARS
ncbi:MAG TPA: ATP-binding protein [Gemmatimonadaceae bacterium]|nr:ATP-binding protein [Gemmatimonadaceae bacterium]